MNTKVFFALTVAAAVLAVIVAGRFPRGHSRPANSESVQAEPALLSTAPESTPSATIAESTVQSRPPARLKTEALVSREPVGMLSLPTNKLERLNQLREAFRGLAAGDRSAALHAARQVTNEVERETALLTLVTEWTHGDLSPPRQRASAIDLYGLEAGLGMELVKNPDLALLWANELTDGAGRIALLQQTAIAMLGADPAAAFALSQQIPEAEQRKFVDAVFAGWAGEDTGAAIQWADQIPDPNDRDAAIRAIRSVAPVGIGASLSIQEGYPVINGLIPGTPAELSGQLHVGDRIIGLAEGNSSFVDAHSLPLSDVVQMIRGAPNTQVQLQVIPADASPNSSPRIVSITRDQLKFKR